MPVVIPVQADDSQFIAAMDDLQDSARRTSKKVVSALDDMSSKGSKSVGKLADSERDAADAAREVETQSAEAAKGFEDLGDAAGLPVDTIKKLSEGLGAALSSMTSAQLGMVALGGAAVAAAAAAALTVGAVSSLVTGVTDLTRASAEAIPGLMALEKASGVNLLPSATVDRVRQADAALDAVGASASVTGAVLAGQLAPHVERVSTLLIAVNLALADFISANTQILDVIGQVGEGLVNNLIAPIKGAILLLGGFLSGVADMADAMGSDLAPALSSVADELLLFGATDFEDNIDGMTEALGRYVPMAQKLVAGQRKVNAEIENTGDAEQEFIDGVNAAIVATGDLFSTTELAAQEANAAIDDVIAAVNDLGAASEEAGDKAREHIGGALDALPSITSAASGGLEAIATLIGGPVAGAITGLILNLKDTIGGLTEQLLSLPQILKDAPALLTGFVVTVVETVIPALMNAAPDIAQALALAVTSPEFIAAIVKLNLMIFNPVTGLKIGVEIARGLWDAFLDGWSYFASGAMVDDFKGALVQGMLDAIQYLRDAWAQIVQTLKDVLSFGADGGGGKVGDALKEVFTLGRATTQYGDTPGVRRAGPQGETFRASAGDIFALARSPQGLMDQAMAAGAKQAGAGSGPVLVLSEHGRAFDGLNYRIQRAGGLAVDIANRARTRTARG